MKNQVRTWDGRVKMATSSFAPSTFLYISFSVQIYNLSLLIIFRFWYIYHLLSFTYCFFNFSLVQFLLFYPCKHCLFFTKHFSSLFIISFLSFSLSIIRLLLPFNLVFPLIHILYFSQTTQLGFKQFSFSSSFCLPCSWKIDKMLIVSIFKCNNSRC